MRHTHPLTIRVALDSAYRRSFALAIIPCPVRIRRVVEADQGFMKEMLFEAFFWDPDMPRPPLAVFAAEAECCKLLGQWGREGDRGLIAERNEMRLGAAWFRLWTAELHSYGFVDPAVPEIAMAVRKTFRSTGIGRMLLASLVELARAEGFQALILSVSPMNYALKLYASMGFCKVDESGTSWTLRKGSVKGRNIVFQFVRFLSFQ